MDIDFELELEFDVDIDVDVGEKFLSEGDVSKVASVLLLAVLFGVEVLSAEVLLLRLLLVPVRLNRWSWR